MDKKINNLGNIKGKILLFGGVYSNLQALEALKQVAEKENIPPDNCICTGDIIGYCAQPEETVQLFQLWKAKSIAGNVETQLRKGAENCGCNFKEGSRCDEFSQQWYPFAQSKLSKNSLEFIATFSDHITFNFVGKQFYVVHGSYFNSSAFIFKSTPWEHKQSNFEKTKSDVIVGGHCGLPFYHKKNNRLWLNPGVIGMPANDGNSSVWYVVLDDKNGFSYQFKTLEYDYKKAYTLMIDNKLPLAYANTLVSGIWDTMEILPEQERKLKEKDLKTFLIN